MGSSGINTMYETFSFLPPLSDMEIAKQVDYIIGNSWTPCLEVSPAETSSTGDVFACRISHHRHLLRQPLLVPVEAAHVRLHQRLGGPARDPGRQDGLPQLLHPRVRLRLRAPGAGGLLPGAAHFHRPAHRPPLRDVSGLLASQSIGAGIRLWK